MQSCSCHTSSTILVTQAAFRDWAVDLTYLIVSDSGSNKLSFVSVGQCFVKSYVQRSSSDTCGAERAMMLMSIAC